MDFLRNEAESGKSFQVWFLYDAGFCRSLSLPLQVEGKFYPEGGGKDVWIESVGGRWMVRCRNNVRLQDMGGRIVSEPELRDNISLYVTCEQKKDNLILYAQRTGRSSGQFHNYRILGDAPVRIGRREDNDLVYLSPMIPEYGITLQKGRDGMQLQAGSAWAFVNGKRASRGQNVKIGDRILIFGLKIIIGIDYISINDVSGRVRVQPQRFVPYRPETGTQLPAVPDKKDEIYNRLPRKHTRIDVEPIIVEKPPASMNMKQAPMFLRMGSSMVMGANAVLRGSYLSVLSMLLFPLLNSAYSEEDKKEYEKLRVVRYREYLEQKRHEITQNRFREGQELNRKYPPIDSILTFPAEQRLWERRSRDEDFLELRLGQGSIPMLSPLQYPEKHFELEEDPLERAMYDLVEKAPLLSNAPIILPLAENTLCSVDGIRKDRLEMMMQILLQIAFLYSYDEVKIVLLLDDEVLGHIPMLRFLPHLWDDEKTIRFLATDGPSGYLIGEYLSRQITIDENHDQELDKILKKRPYYVVLAWNRQVYENIEIIKKAADEETNVGMSVVTFFDEPVVNAKGLVQLHSQTFNDLFCRKDGEQKSITFEMERLHLRQAVEGIKVLANTKLKVLQETFVLPKMITFLEMFGVGRVEQLNPLKRWQENDPTKSLAARIGIGTDGESFMLDLHEKYQGPHGLVAGMTGSGKSEFLITYILSLAVDYHPDEVSFLLIDYKGGGLADAFENPEKKIHLPHLAGTITNLDGGSITRALKSIESELKRRQRIFQETKRELGEGTMDIYGYQKLYRNQKVKEPMPHLFIISDEFAELKSQEPEFMDQLISTARIGRSLGVHLILATQKPAGVVNEQINSNAKFRVCLKVQSRADSDEMLRRPEAAELRDTGRFYLQVGYNEYFALGQSAWCGAPYEPQDEVVVHRDDAVQFIDNAGQNLLQVKPKVEKKKADSSQLVAIVRYLSDLAEKEGIQPRKLWEEPLPEEIDLEKLQKENPQPKGKTVSMVLGWVDDPENQTSFPYVLDLNACKNLAIIGGNQTGKTTLLQSILYSVSRMYAPQDVNYYILDYSSGLLQTFEEAPHCGGVWGEGDESGAEKFFVLLKDLIDERKKDFREVGVNTFEAYREVKRQPLILVVIDNLIGLNSWKKGKDILYDLNQTVRDAYSVGIRFLITAGNGDDLSYRMKKEVGTRVILSAKNRMEFGDLLGVNCRFEPQKLPGRGLYRLEDRPLECQFARFGAGLSEQAQNEKMKAEIERIKTAFPSGGARRLPKIREDEDFAAFCADIPHKRLPLGYSTTEVKKVSIPFKQLHCMGVYIGYSEYEEKILSNYVYAANREGMHLFIVKRKSGSIFERESMKKLLEGSEEVTFFECTKESGVELAMKLYGVIGERKAIRNRFAEANNLPTKGDEIMRLCFEEMYNSTYPLLVIFERMDDFVKETQSDCQNVLEKIFKDGKGYNYYFMGIYTPEDDSSLTYKGMQEAFASNGFSLLHGGCLDKQKMFGSMPMEFRRIDKPFVQREACFMQYRGKFHSMWMPCGKQEVILDPDEESII